MKTKAEDIKHRLLLGYDQQYYASLWRLTNQAFGEPWNKFKGAVDWQSTRFPDFPDIRPKFREIGTTNKILETQAIVMANVLADDPEPEFPDVDKITAEMRKQAFLARARGTGYADGEWSNAWEQAFLEGDGLGVGILQFGLKTNPKTGYQYTHCRHVPLLQTLWDRNERSIGRARWVALMHYMPWDVAEATYGSKIKDYKRELREAFATQPIEVVRIFEYFDLGYGKGDPTYAVIPGDLDQDPISVDDNPYGRLPIAYYEGDLWTGQRRPSGRFAKLVQGQAAINEVERALRQAVRQPGFMAVASDLVDEQDWQKVVSGDSWYVRIKRSLSPGETPIFEAKGKDAQVTTLNYLAGLEKSFNAAAGVNDFDRGNLSTQNKTLGENLLLDERSKGQMSRTARMAAKFYRRMVECFTDIAKIGDRDPVDIAVGDTLFTLNDPGDPATSMAQIFSEPSRVIISEQSLMKNDMMREQAQKAQNLMQLADLVQGGLIDPTKWAEERVEAAGLDPDEFKVQQEGPMAPAGMMTQPGPMPSPGGGAPGTAAPPMPPTGPGRS